MRSSSEITWRAASAILALSILTLGDDCPTREKRARAPKTEAATASSVPAAGPPVPTPATSDPPAAPPSRAPELFQASVRPILAARCAPCHEPGGKMYGRLPFDQAAVVASHADGVRRRLHGADREALEAWLAALPTRPTSD